MERRPRRKSYVQPPQLLPRVIVFGAGPVGLAVAGGLRERGFNVEVFEKRDTIPTVGGALQLHVEGISALRMLRDSRLRQLFLKNCETVVRKIEITDLRRCSEDEPCGRVLHEIDLVGRYGASGVLCTMRRSRVISILQDTLKGPVPVLSKVCRNIEEGKTLTVDFEDGTKAQCELLIAADGSHSVVRSMLFPESKFRSAHAWCIGGVARLPPNCPAVSDEVALKEISEIIGENSTPVSPEKPRSPLSREQAPFGRKPMQFRLGSDSECSSPDSGEARTARARSREAISGAFQFNRYVLLLQRILENSTYQTAFSPNFRLYVCKCDSRSVGWYISFPFTCKHLDDLPPPPWTPDVVRTLIKRIAQELIGDSCDLFQALIELTPEEGEDAPFVWEQGDADPVPYYSRNNIVLVGDAAHTMLSPNPVGQGINQGLGDAAVLVDLMEEELHRINSSDVAEFNVASVLSAFSQRRQPLTSEFQIAQHRSYVPFGKWGFTRVLMSSGFLEDALAPLDHFTRSIVERDTVSSKPSRLLQKEVVFPILASIAVVCLIAARLYFKGRLL